MNLFLRRSPLVVVAAIAAFASYFHQFHVAVRYGETFLVACVLPFSVDGMLVVATIAMVEDRRADRQIRGWARLSFVGGVAASIAANIAAAQPTWGGRIVAAWPALALLSIVEIQSRVGKPIPVPLPPEPVLTVPAQSFTELPAARPTNGTRVARGSGEISNEALRTKVAALRRQEPTLSIEALARLCSVGKKRISEALEPSPELTSSKA